MQYDVTQTHSDLGM